MVGERRAASSFHEAVTRKDLLRGAETWEQVHGSPGRYTDRHPLCPWSREGTSALWAARSPHFLIPAVEVVLFRPVHPPPRRPHTRDFH